MAKWYHIPMTLRTSQKEWHHIPMTLMVVFIELVPRERDDNTLTAFSSNWFRAKKMITPQTQRIGE